MTATKRAGAALAVLFIAATAHGHEPDVTRLPIGDGKRSDALKVGWLWACRIEEDGRGPLVTGPWIKADGTYDFSAKPAIAGAVTWPHRFFMSIAGNRRVFTSDDLPNHPTGVFPVAPEDPARRYDPNPNRITPQRVEFSVPAEPALATPQCAPGAVGILLTGTVLFNGFDANGHDAVAHELQDKCQGHPQQSGTYHYHSVTTCFDDTTLPNGHSTLVGYAIDGFGIYGRRGEGGAVLSSTDLDPCHGHTHTIEWNGKTVEMYHYHGTQDFPYTVGCLRGTYELGAVAALSGGPRGGMSARPGPPSVGGPPRRPLSDVALQLGIPEARLREALGPPPPDIESAARKLGISAQTLRDALGAPHRPFN